MSVARLLSCLGKHPLSGVLAGEEDERLDATRLRLAQSGLALSGAGATRGVVRRDQLLDHSPAALFVDDVDLLEGVTPEHVANWSSTGAFVCVTLPRHLVVHGDRRDTYLDPGWARVADLVLEVRIHDLSDEDGRDRLGEADLSVLKNRRGPLWTSTVAFQGFYSRFVDLSP